MDRDTFQDSAAKLFIKMSFRQILETVAISKYKGS